MNRLVRWCYWDLHNEFTGSGYFAAMLSMYCIIDLIFGVKEVNIFILLEMFLINYVLAILQKLVLDFEKDYPAHSILLRAIGLGVISIVSVVVVSRLGGWFDGLPVWAEIVTYSIMLLSYATVWIITALYKKFDTKKLNEQLQNYQNINRKEQG